MDKRKNWEIVDSEKQLSFEEEIYSIHKVNPEGMHPTYKTAYEKAVEIVKGKRIQLNEFSSHVDLAKDKQAVIKKIDEINSDVDLDGSRMEVRAQAEILETMLYVFSIDFSWFGENTSSILPSAYDDLFLGNDLILEHKVDNLVSHTGLGIDITLSEEKSLSKLEDTRKRIKNGELDRVKYFKSPDGRYKGELNNIPHFVVGMDRANLFKLADLWIKNKNKDIKNHPVQILLLDQMITQCDYFVSLLIKEISRISKMKTTDEFQQKKRDELIEKFGVALNVYSEEKIRLNKSLEDRKRILTENGIDFKNYKDAVSQTISLYVQKRESMPDRLQ